MSGLFGGGDGSQGLQQAPPAPTVNDAEVSAQQTADKLRKRRGMASTILAGANTATATTPATKAASLLGS